MHLRPKNKVRTCRDKIKDNREVGSHTVIIDARLQPGIPCHKHFSLQASDLQVVNNILVSLANCLEFKTQLVLLLVMAQFINMKV